LLDLGKRRARAGNRTFDEDICKPFGRIDETSLDLMDRRMMFNAVGDDGDQLIDHLVQFLTLGSEKLLSFCETYAQEFCQSIVTSSPHNRRPVPHLTS